MAGALQFAELLEEDGPRLDPASHLTTDSHDTFEKTMRTHGSGPTSSLSGALWDNVWRELSDSDLVRRIWNSVRDLRDVHGISEEAMADIVSEVWWDRAFRAGEQGASGPKVAEVLPAHDAETISSSNAHDTLGKLANRIRYEGRVALLDQLPETRPQRGTGESQKRRRREAWRGPGNGVNRDRPATESIGIRGSRLLKGEACRLC